jgi:tetrahydromethanopterin S-methyltransferase subunit C
MDIQAAAKAKVGKRKDFIKTEEVKVYPDTTVWIKIPIMSQCTMIIFGTKHMVIILLLV